MPHVVLTIEKLEKTREQEQELMLEQEIVAWRKRLARALLTNENNQRSENRKPPYLEDTPIWIPYGPNANLFLLTLKVWCLRYCVSPEFVLEHTMVAKRFLRKKSTGGMLSLGIPMMHLAGSSARAYLEAVVKRHYPENENVTAMSQPVITVSATKTELVYEQDFEDMIHNYRHTLERSRKKREKIITRSQTSKRNYRRSSMEDI